MTFSVGDRVELFAGPWVLFDDPKPPPWRRPAGLLADRGVFSPDDPRNVSAGHVAVLRAVAEHVGLGGWCDAFAWADVVNPYATAAATLDVEPEPELFAP